MLSTHTPTRALVEIAARRAIFAAPTTSLLTSTSGTPASMSACASDTFWQHTPTAPSAIWRIAMSADLWVLACGRTRILEGIFFLRVSRFFSNASRSRISAGVSTSPRRCPTLAGGGSMAGTRDGVPGDGDADDGDERQREQVDALPAAQRDGHPGAERGHRHDDEDRLVVGTLRLGELLGPVGFGEQRGA